MTDPIPPAATTPQKRFSWARVLLTALVVGLIVVGAFGYVYYTNTQIETVDSSKLFTGYLKNSESQSTLAAEYTDANGDLVADAPSAEKLIDPKELIFSEIATDDPEKAAEVWKPFLAYLSEKTGKPCKFYVNPAYAPAPTAPAEPDADETARSDAKGVSFDDELEALKTGRLHICAFSTGQVKAATNLAGFQPLFAPATKDNQFSYTMEVIVPADSPAKTVAGLKGKRVGLVALSSNSGAKAPLVLFQEKFQLNPKTDYIIQITGRHEQSMKLVCEKQLDAACVASDLLKREVDSGRIKADQYKSIYSSPPYPKLCFGTAHNLNADLMKKIRTAFETFQFAGNSVGQKYQADDATHFHPVDYKTDWASVREIDDSLVSILKGK